MTGPTTSDQPLEVLRRSLALLTTGPGQPVLPTTALKGVHAEELTATEVLNLLRHGPHEVTDELWHRVFAQARQGETAWTVIAAGAMVPRMVAACSRYARVPGRHIPDVEAEMLAALMEQVHALPPGVKGVGEQLWSAVANTAGRCAYLNNRDRHRSIPYNPNAHATDQVTGGRGPVTVLAEAITTGTLSPVEADLVARTRLENTKLAQVAEEMGLTYITARRWRRAAEGKLEKVLGTR